MKLSTQRRNDVHGAPWRVGDVGRAPATDLITPSAVMSNDYALGAPCRPKNGSPLEISTHFGTGHQALIAKGARRLKETST